MGLNYEYEVIVRNVKNPRIEINAKGNVKVIVPPSQDPEDIIKKNGNYGSEIIGFPKNWKEKLEEEKKYEDAERKRLEYVAVTRAKNILVVSTYREGSRAKAWEFLYDYLSNAPEINVKDRVKAIGREVFSISKDKWQVEQEKIAKRLEGIREDSYKLKNITSEFVSLSALRPNFLLANVITSFIRACSGENAGSASMACGPSADINHDDVSVA